jgi:hypothetical protein
MINEEAIVLDLVAECADLVRNLGLILKGAIESEISCVLAIVKELNGAWVAVVVDIPPASLHGFHALEYLPAKVNLFGLADKVSASEP